MDTIKPFDELNVSTKTVMIYSSLIINGPKLFAALPIYEIKDVPLTRKKKRPNLKKIHAPDGSIISIRRKIDNGEILYRGIVTKPEKVRISYLRRRKKDSSISADESEELFKMENTKKFSTVIDFLNQTTVVICLNGKCLNVMIFNSELKIVGCKSEEDGIKVLKMLWIHMKDSNITTFKEGQTSPCFLINVVMTNVDFKLGFYVNRMALNTLLNDPKYAHKIRKSTYETTAQTNVKVKMFTSPPDDFHYNTFEWDDKNKTWIKGRSKTNIYQSIKKKKRKEDNTTLLVFRTSTTILISKYPVRMAEDYKFFWGIVMENRHLIEEKIIKPINMTSLKIKN